MRVRTYASQFYDLGEIDPAWHPSELDKDFSFLAKFVSHDAYGQMRYVTEYSQDTTDENPLRYDGLSESEEQLAHITLRGVAMQIDRMVRDYREYDDTQKTSIIANYRAGHARATGILGAVGAGVAHRMFGQNSYVPAGNTHFDNAGMDAEHFDNNLNTVILSRGGRPTKVHLGPVFRSEWGDRPSATGLNLATFVGRLGIDRFSAMVGNGSVHAPENHAVLINEGTQHQQSRQFFNRDKPPVFVHTFVRLLDV